MEPAGLRERKKLRTSTAIEDAALRLFTERGYDATTIDDIAAEADIAPRTFFRYFPSKEEVVFAHYAERMTLLRAALAERPANETAMAAIRNAFREVAQDFESQRDALLLRARLMAATPALRVRNLEMQMRWEHLIAEAAAPRLGVPVGDLSVRLLAAAAVAAMRVSLENWLAEGGTSSLPHRFDAALDLIERGL